MAGTFRLKRGASHTRFEGKDGKERKRYHGEGHPDALDPGGDLITLSEEELRKFKNPYDRLSPMAGADWSPITHLINIESSVEDKPDRLALLLSNTAEIVVGELKSDYKRGILDIPDVERVLAMEKEGGGARASITKVCNEMLKELSSK